MTEQAQPQQVVPVDPGNTMTGPGTCKPLCGVTSDRQNVFVTFRVPSATLTLLWTGEQVDQLIQELHAARGQLSGLVIPTGPVDLSKFSPPNGR